MGTELEGIVERRRLGRGSKSEHVAVVLRTDAGLFKLRRRGGHAFHVRRWNAWWDAA